MFKSFEFNGKFVYTGEHWVVNVFRDEEDWCVDVNDFDARRTLMELFELLQEDD